MAERGVWVGGGDIFGSSVHCAHLDTGTPPEAPAASVADVETVHKKDRPACGHTQGRQGQIT